MMNKPVILLDSKSNAFVTKVLAVFKDFEDNWEAALRYMAKHQLTIIDRKTTETESRWWVKYHPPTAPRFEPWKEPCQHRIEVETPPRPVNGLNIEVGSPQPRCLQKPPKHIKNPEHFHALRWLASGGDPLIFGWCSPDCPKLKEHL